MNRIRIFAVLAIAIGAGGALAFGTYNYMNSGTAAAPTASVPTRAVVVAAADLQLGAELRSEDLKVIQWPETAVPDGVFQRASDLVGRGLITQVVRHEPILPSKLAPDGAGAGLPPVIPPGMRAVSVRTNEVIGVAGYVLPGTRVDVVTTQSPTDARGDIMSKVVLSNVQVLTAGTRMEQDQDRGKPVAVTVVTLLVTPVQAERLALASTEGKIQLALRNPLDHDAPETPGIRPAVLLGTARAAARPAAPRAAAAPAAAPAPVADVAPTVEIIRGDKRQRETIR